MVAGSFFNISFYNLQMQMIMHLMWYLQICGISEFWLLQLPRSTNTWSGNSSKSWQHSIQILVIMVTMRRENPRPKPWCNLLNELHSYFFFNNQLQKNKTLLITHPLISQRSFSKPWVLKTLTQIKELLFKWHRLKENYSFKKQFLSLLLTLWMDWAMEDSMRST